MNIECISMNVGALPLKFPEISQTICISRKWKLSLITHEKCTKKKIPDQVAIILQREILLVSFNTY